MNRNDLHPVEVLLIVAWLALEAAWILARVTLAPLIAMALTIAAWRPAAPPPEPTPPTRPVVHPLVAIADDLSSLPVTTLRQLAGVRSKRHRKADLIAMVAACS